MSTHAFIPDPVINHFLHVSLQIPAIVICAILVIIGIIFVYAFFFKAGKTPKEFCMGDT